MVNNAGVMATLHRRTVDGFEMPFGVNHLGHWALAAHPMATVVHGGRVVSVTSSARANASPVEPAGHKRRRRPRGSRTRTSRCGRWRRAALGCREVLVLGAGTTGSSQEGGRSPKPDPSGRRPHRAGRSDGRPTWFTWGSPEIRPIRRRSREAFCTLRKVSERETGLSRLPGGIRPGPPASCSTEITAPADSASRATSRRLQAAVMV